MRNVDSGDAGGGVGGEATGSSMSFAAALSQVEEREHTEAIGGDAASIDKLWRRHRRWVAAILLAHKPRWADLDDLLQEVAVAVVRKISDVRDPRAVRPWLRTVAVNVAAASARSGARRAKDIQSDEAITPAISPVNAEREREIAEGRKLLALAAELPEGYREPLLLKAVHNLSYREIGQIMSLPETTIETRIARGRRQLRELAVGAAMGPAAVRGSAAGELKAEIKSMNTRDSATDSVTGRIRA
ncbi:MAG: sigma-70 family RNA polymerase sigma factor [Phycisphaerales bacterium]